MKYSYNAFIVTQRPAVPAAPRFALFSAPAAEVLKWAAIHRLSKGEPNAVQREPKKSRINGIRRFLEIIPINTIPTAVVVSINGVTLERLVAKEADSNGDFVDTGCDNLFRIIIDVPTEAQLPGFVLDGQHRLKGISSADETMVVNVVALIDADDTEKAFQFLVINNKAAKVSTDHIRAMVSGLASNADELNYRLRKAKVSFDANVGSISAIDLNDDSPFKGLIKWPLNVSYEGETPKSEGFVPGAAIEIAIGYIRAKNAFDLDDIDTVQDLFIAIWATIKEAWPDLFVEGSKLLSKVGIVCMTEFVFDQLRDSSINKRSEFSLADTDEVIVRTKELLDQLAKEFWIWDWKSTSYDTRAGRDQIVAELDTIRGNISDGRVWHSEVKMIRSADIKEEQQ